ncbi:hypothetical protein TNCV_2755881 [Trichonephila clavipes]|nr:hypothetical protein TNCV_2755881 [Trichonephila clavipes]
MVHRNTPGFLQEIKFDCGSQTVLARLTRGHQKCLSFDSGRKNHPTCKKCWDIAASPDHILRCIWLSKGVLIIQFHYYILFGYKQPSRTDLTYVISVEDKGKQHKINGT